MQPDLSGQIQAELSHLGPEGQQKVLEFVRSLNGSEDKSELPPGTPVSEWLKLGGLIAPEELKLMEKAIEEGCEQVDRDGW